MCTTCNACPSIYGMLTIGCWMVWNLDPVPIIMHIEVSINGIVVQEKECMTTWVVCALCKVGLG
jgi:uncharacterized membrane protein